MNKKNDSKQVMLERKKKSVEKMVGNMFIKYDENDSDGTPQQSN